MDRRWGFYGSSRGKVYLMYNVSEEIPGAKD